KIIFRIKYRYFKYLVILFRLINISIFGKYLNRFIIIYLDNILIFSKNKKEYIKYIRLILYKLYLYHL
ncbi:hypothetical protein ASPTUDRAFT_137529, partial [Aspergillus tubingensis CBS 134.48]